MVTFLPSLRISGSKQVFFILKFIFYRDNQYLNFMKKLGFILLMICLATLSLPAQKMMSIVAASSFGGGSPVTTTHIYDMKVFPNPTTNGKITISFSVINHNGNVTVKLYNLIGREVFMEQVSGEETEYQRDLQLNDYQLPKGVYILEVSDGTQKQTKRISFM